jgi:ATP-dependent RNA helicase DHX57
MYPEADDTQPSSEGLNAKATSQVASDLGLLEFTGPQQKKAIAFLSEDSPLASALLGNLTPLEAAIEFLVLNVPEVDLPERFLPQNNSSNSFVTSAHTGTDDLKKRWVEDKAIKQAGWPAHAVRQLTQDAAFVNTWEHLIRALGKKLLGLDTTDIFIEESPDTEVVYTVTEAEVDAMGAILIPDSEPPELAMPMFSAPIELHVLCEAGYSSTRCPAIFVTSKTVPAYVRLHLLAKVLLAIEDGTLIEPGEGLFMACMRVLEDEWAVVESQGPPEMAQVLQHLMPPKPESKLISNHDMTDSTWSRAENKQREGPRSKGTRSKQDDRTDVQVQTDFDSVKSSSKYTELLKSRERLPAFKARKEFLDVLKRNRVVVVVGETGMLCWICALNKFDSRIYKDVEKQLNVCLNYY